MYMGGEDLGGGGCVVRGWEEGSEGEQGWEISVILTTIKMY